MNRENQFLNTIDDFNEKNIFSKVFEPKHNKSIEYDQKKQAHISRIIENFPNQSRVDTFQQKLAENQDGGTTSTTMQGPSFQEMSKREMAKKQKAMEAKLYQDQQILAKLAEREAAKKQQQDEYERVVREVEDFKKEEAKKRMDVKHRRKAYIDEVKRQMQETPRTFAKTGVAIINVNNESSLL